VPKRRPFRSTGSHMTGGESPNDRRPRRAERAPRADDAALGLLVAFARAGLITARLLERVPGVSPVLERPAETGRAARVRGRERIENAAQTALAAPEVGRLVDGALAGPLPEAVARSSVEHHIADRLATELGAELDRVMQRFLDSPEFDHALERALSSPKVREALAHQTTGLAEEIADRVRVRASRLDDRLTIGSRETAPYAGLASRALAFGIDLVLAYLLFLVGATIVALVVSLVGDLRPAWLFGILAGAGWFLVVGSYFVFFWTLGGQTPGMRLLHLRVAAAHGDPPSVLRAVLRFGGLVLAIIPMFAGFVPVVFDRRRRGVHDMLAGTVVVYAD
jgi:uncharacterized RDD family membrane protein YckC